MFELISCRRALFPVGLASGAVPKLEETFITATCELTCARLVIP